MLQVTEKAKSKVAEIMSQEGKVDAGLRVQVMGGGCSGFQYGLTFAEAPVLPISWSIAGTSRSSWTPSAPSTSRTRPWTTSMG